MLHAPQQASGFRISRFKRKERRKAKQEDDETVALRGNSPTRRDVLCFVVGMFSTLIAVSLVPICELLPRSFLHVKPASLTTYGNAPHEPRAAAETLAILPPASSLPQWQPDSSRHGKRTMYVRGVSRQVKSTLLNHGWLKVNAQEKAEICWTHKLDYHFDWDLVQPGQRINHFQDERIVSNKGQLIAGLREAQSPILKMIPESYLLWNAEERRAFSRVVSAEEAAGKGQMWLLKHPGKEGGKGITILQPEEVAKEAKMLERHQEMIAQRYTTNLLLLDGRKFDLRMFFLVATSKFGHLVFYHPGYMRLAVGRLDRRESKRQQHLTNVDQQGSDLDDAEREDTRKPLTALWRALEEHAQRGEGWPADARAHVECEMQRAIAGVFVAFAQRSFRPDPRAEDNFSLLGADFLLTEQLEVVLTEVQDGPGMRVVSSAVADSNARLLPAALNLLLHIRAAHHAGLRSTDLPRPLPDSDFVLVVNGSSPVLSPSCSPLT